ncbi:hypothetical protein BDN71DRAFT_1458614, partial [Pleurotus eryngii]
THGTALNGMAIIQRYSTPLLTLSLLAVELRRLILQPRRAKGSRRQTQDIDQLCWALQRLRDSRLRFHSCM